jgi:hypothetical protein
LRDDFLFFLLADWLKIIHGISMILFYAVFTAGIFHVETFEIVFGLFWDTCGDIFSLEVLHGFVFVWDRQVNIMVFEAKVRILSRVL